MNAGVGDTSAVVLGIMQDAGLPHAGCRCPRCTAAFESPELSDSAAALAILDDRSDPAGVWLVDATPDIGRQLNLLAPFLGRHPTRPERLRQPDALFLTHAHMGHTLGLAQLGPEGMAVADLPVYASAGLVEALRNTQLWQPLLANLRLRPLAAHQPIALAPDLSLTPIPVPHRDELGAGTFAFLIRGPRRALLYLPDIDRWDAWPEATKVLSACDVALLDASFFSADELGGRPPVAHPLVPETIALSRQVAAQVLLTHLNHTNPLLDEESPAREMVAAAGLQVAQTGQMIDL